MQLFYTTTTGYNLNQPNAGRSLGGFKSSTQVVNDDFANMFDEISLMTIRNGRDEYRAIIIYNDDETPIRNIRVSGVIPESAICSYRVAPAPMKTVNKYGQKAMESVQAPTNRPFNAEFQTLNARSFVDITQQLNPGQEIGLWICRSVDKEKAKKQYDTVSVPDPTDPTGRRYMSAKVDKEETIDIVFEYD